MKHIRAVLSQCGVAMELHGERPEPVTVALVSPAELGEYRKHLAETNPGMMHATIGQLAIMYANRIFQGIEINQFPWTFNASTNEYNKA